MIPVESLLYKIDLKLNKVAALDHQIIPLENKILALNEAQLKLIKLKMDPNNTLGLGLDSFKKRYEDLAILMQPFIDHPLALVSTDENLNKYTADLKLLTPEYMFYIDSYFIATKGQCKNKIIYVNQDLVKHSDIITLLTNTNYRPSFEHAESFCTISNFKISIYTDGTFTPSTIYVSYMKYPQRIDYPGYVKLDGTASIHTDCELPEYLEDELLNLAIQELAMDTENMPAVQFTQERIRTSE